MIKEVQFTDMEWRHVPGYEGLYMVNNYGEIMRCKYRQTNKLTERTHRLQILYYHRTMRRRTMKAKIYKTSNPRFVKYKEINTLEELLKIYDCLVVSKAKEEYEKDCDIIVEIYDDWRE